MNIVTSTLNMKPLLNEKVSGIKFKFEKARVTFSDGNVENVTCGIFHYCL